MNPDGSIEVRYRRKEGEDAVLKKEFDTLRKKLGANCPYFYRKSKIKI
jgi:hypothetical protein